MSNEVLMGLVMAGVFGGLTLAGLLLNGPRASRWERRQKAAAGVACGSCHRSGTIAVRTTSPGYASSSNMILACSACGSSDWKVV